jgi:hypothetical protein
MTNGLVDIIKKLEHQWTAIERALKALREIEVPGFSSELLTPAPAVAKATGGARKAKRKGGMTPEGRRRLSESLKARWAVKRAGSAVKAKTTAKAKRKGGMTPEGRKRLSEALKARWAAKKAGSAASPVKTKGRGKRKAA